MRNISTRSFIVAIVAACVAIVAVTGPVSAMPTKPDMQSCDATGDCSVSK
jgi:hypothetical protein